MTKKLRAKYKDIICSSVISDQHKHTKLAVQKDLSELSSSESLFFEHWYYVYVSLSVEIKFDSTRHPNLFLAHKSCFHDTFSLDTTKGTSKDMMYL